MKRENFVTADGKTLSLAVWDEVENAKGVVQIAHGMAEHIARYDDFARFLNANGFIVVGDDHRAHGLTDKDRLGKSEDDLFEKTVNDEISITKMLKSRYGLPVVLFGHSYGSFLTQRYLQHGDNGLNGAVLCGSALMGGIAINFAHFLAKLKYKKHRDEEGKLFASLTFDSYDKKIKEGKGAWLNQDKAQVEKYAMDDLSGFTCSNGFYRWFFGGLKQIYKQKSSPLNKDFPLLIISGEKDMVGGCGKLVKKLEKRYIKQGLSPKTVLYAGARHEILNEINKEEVYKEILQFLSEIL